MKSQLVKRLGKKYILPYMSEYDIKGHLIYHKELQIFLCGFWFESSAFSASSFTVEVFIQPLFIPQTDIYFNFGSRLGSVSKGRDIWWEYSDEEEEEIMQEILGMIQHHGLPYLEKVRTVEGFIKQYGQFNRSERVNIHRMEAIGYGYVLSGDNKRAKNLLDRLSIELEQEIVRYPDKAWQREMQSRVRLILGFIQNQDQEAAIQQLEEWKEYTLSHLGLKETKTT